MPTSLLSTTLAKTVSDVYEMNSDYCKTIIITSLAPPCPKFLSYVQVFFGWWCCLRPTKFIQDHLCDHRFGTIHLCLMDSSVSPSPRIHQWLVVHRAHEAFFDSLCVHDGSEVPHCKYTQLVFGGQRTTLSSQSLPPLCGFQE